MTSLTCSVRLAAPLAVRALGFALLISGISAAAAEPQTLPEGLVLKQPAIPESITGALRRVNATMSKDLVPSENAGVFLIQLVGQEAFEPELRSRSLAMLGIESLSKTAPRLVYPEAYVKSKGERTPDEIDRELQDLQGALATKSDRLWKPDDAPAVAAFLEANRAALDALVAAAGKPRYYVPMLANDNPPRLISASLVIERRLPYLARILTSRAMLRAGGDDFAGASADLVACHRLARLLASGSPFDVSGAQAYIIDSYACRAEFALLESGRLTGEQATRHRESLASLPPLLSSVKAADIGERAILHQEIEFLQKDKSELREFFEIPEKDEKLPEIKWDLALKEADAIQDQIVTALSTRDRKAQEDLFRKLDAAYEKWMDESNPPGKKGPPLPADLDVASRAVGEAMAMSLRPLYWKRRESEQRARVRADMVQIGLALVAACRAQEEFPATLADLVPKYLKTVPTDAFGDVPFTYDRAAPGRARLTSWGANRTDDAGTFFNDDVILEIR